MITVANFCGSIIVCWCILRCRNCSFFLPLHNSTFD